MGIATMLEVYYLLSFQPHSSIVNRHNVLILDSLSVRCNVFSQLHSAKEALELQTLSGLLP